MVVVVCKPILVFSFDFGQAEQLAGSSCGGNEASGSGADLDV